MKLVSVFREIFLAPLIVTDLLGKLDITGKITDGPGGTSVIPRIIRYGTSLCIAALFPEHFDKLRLGIFFHHQWLVNNLHTTEWRVFNVVLLIK